MTRTFEIKPAKREAVPLLVGLFGPSGSGKTFSALRVATGIQKVVGGEIGFIDTEARRALHYADLFKFRHMEFEAPFGALDYLAALTAMQRSGVRTIIVDSMSHEHEGPGGLLEQHAAEVERLAGDGANFQRREAVKMLAWQRPKQARRQLINALLRMRSNFVFCFRAKETAKPVRKRGDDGKLKTEVVQMGFMPIAGDEFVFEMTVACLLQPHSGGVPTWDSENVGERAMTKLPVQFEPIFKTARPLSEDIGAELATWARGEVVGFEPSFDFLELASSTAQRGTDAFREWYKSLGREQRGALNLEEMQRIAEAADAARNQGKKSTAERLGSPPESAGETGSAPSAEPGEGNPALPDASGQGDFGKFDEVGQ